MNQDFESQLLMRQANEQFEQLEQNKMLEEEQKQKNEEEELSEDQKERRRILTEAQLSNKYILYAIHQKDIEIMRIQKQVEDHKEILFNIQQEHNVTDYLSHRALVSYDSYLRGTLREQDRKIYELELNNADISEIQARIDKINKEYEKNIQPLVVGDFKSQIDADIKSSKNQIEALRNQFKEIVDDIIKLHEKHLDNIDMYLNLPMKEQLLANEQLEFELSQLQAK